MTATAFRWACAVATAVVLIAAFAFVAADDPEGRDATYYVVLFIMLLVALVPVVIYGVWSRGRRMTPICGVLIFTATAGSWVPVVTTQESLALVYPTMAFLFTVGASLFAALW